VFKIQFYLTEEDHFNSFYVSFQHVENANKHLLNCSEIKHNISNTD